MTKAETHWLSLIAKRLRKESEVLTQDDLPRRWVDLLHRLVEEEQKRDMSETEDGPEDSRDR